MNTPGQAGSNRRLLFELQPEREARSRNRRCGFCVTIARSKTDQAGEGCEITIPRGYRLRPVEAVQTWLAAAEISSGPVFRGVIDKQVAPGPLNDDSASRIVKRYAARLLRRPQPPQRVPHECCRSRRLGLEA